MKWDEGLLYEQPRAASHRGCHARLVAGPGTGKTMVVRAHALYLIQECGVSPRDITIITFTRKAAQELLRRMREAIPAGEIPIVSTLHSLSLRQLLSNQDVVDSLPRPIRVADDYEENNIIRQDLKRIMSLKDVRETRKFIDAMSAKWDVLADPEEDLTDEQIAKFIGAWRVNRSALGYTLRSEMVYRLARALPNSNFKYDCAPKYLLVDEFQDLNPCDLSIVRWIANRLQAEVFVAGDDDQSIYGFRHSNLDGIRRFTEQYLPSEGLELRECHRCEPAVLRASVLVADQDRDPARLRKQLSSVLETNTGEVRLLRFPHETAEAYGIADICRHLVLSCGIQLGDILVLLRSDDKRAFSNELLEAFRIRHAPAAARESESPLDGEDGRRLLAILRIALLPSDLLSWRTLLMLKPGAPAAIDLQSYAENVGRTFHSVLFDDAIDIGVSSNRMTRLRKKRDEYVRICEKVRQTLADGNKDLSEKIESALVDIGPSIESAREATSYLMYLREASHAATIDELIAVASVGLGACEQETQPNCVNILTMHQAKGLTAEVVFIVAADDELIPGYAKGRAEEDERRLLYVLMTRARRFLYITHVDKRLGTQMKKGREKNMAERQLTRFLRDNPFPDDEDGQAYLSTIRQLWPIVD